MLIGYERPDNPAAAISGVGAEFVSDVVLFNGYPAEITRIRWLSDATPSLTDYVAIQITWSTAITVRAGDLYGLQYLTAVGSPIDYGAPLRLPTGVRVTITGKRSGDSGFPYALGGNSTTEESGVLPLPGSPIHVPWVFDSGLTPLIGVEIRIYNDANGLTWADPDTYLDIGEIVLTECVTVCGRPGWSEQLIDPTRRARTLGSQVHKVARRAYREAKLSIGPTTLSGTRGEGLAQSQDLQLVRAALAQSSPCLFIPHYLGEDGAFSSAELRRTILFGVADPDPISHVPNSPAKARRYEQGYTVGELPPK